MKPEQIDILQLIEDESKMTDRVIIDGAFSQGVGMTPMTLSCDPSISDATTRIYSLLSGFANSMRECFPSVELQMQLMGMGRKKYYDARKPLEALGYVSVFKGARNGSKWEHNTYVLHLNPLSPRFIAIEAKLKACAKELVPELLDLYHRGAGAIEFLLSFDEGSLQNAAADDGIEARYDGTVCPEAQSTALVRDSGKRAKPQMNGEFDFRTPQSGKPAMEQNALVRDSGELTKPQMNGEFDFGTVQNRTANNWNSNFIHTPNSIQPDPRETSRIETAPEARSVPARSDGRTDGARGTTAESNHVPSPPVPSPAPATDAEAEQGWAELSRSSVNRNLIRDGKRPYFALLALGYSIAEIQHAWDRRQDAAKRAGRGPRYYPQLKKWLESDGDDGARMSIERFRSEGGGSPASRSAPRSLSALASRDEAFGRIYWAYCDARQKANQAGVDPERDAECVRLKADMDAEWDAARKRLSAQIE